MKIPLLIGAVLFAASTALYAQAPKADADKGAREERLAKLKAAHEKARAACEGKPREERRACMRREMCAQAKDPAKCEAHAKEAMAMREKIREACQDKKGEELRACIREHRGKK